MPTRSPAAAASASDASSCSRAGSSSPWCQSTSASVPIADPSEARSPSARASAACSRAAHRALVVALLEVRVREPFERADELAALAEGFEVRSCLLERPHGLRVGVGHGEQPAESGAGASCGGPVLGGLECLLEVRPRFLNAPES